MSFAFVPLPECPGPVVFLNGWSGVGKLSLAQTLQMIRGPDRFVVVDHRPPGPAFNSEPPTPDMDDRPDPLLYPPHSYFPEDEAQYSNAGGANGASGARGSSPKRPTAHDIMFKSENLDKCILIMDRVSSDDWEHIECAKEYEAAAARAGRLFLPAYLECGLEENLKRVCSLERTARSTSVERGKIIDPAVARSLREGRQLFRFEREEEEGLTLDVTDLEPAQAAVQLLAWVNVQVDQHRNKLREELRVKLEREERDEAEREARETEEDRKKWERYCE